MQDELPTAMTVPMATLRPRTLLLHASRDALGPMTDVILSKLGYAILPPADLVARREVDADARADLLLVDERRLGEVDAWEDEEIAELPIILLTGQHGATGADARIVGAVKRPAGMHDLYRLLQQLFEETPRSTPRVATQLRAHCSRGSRSWEARLLSLSENGCLMRSPETVPLGQKIQLNVQLPRAGEIALEAEAAYQLLPDVGFVFNAVPAVQRHTIGRFVAQTLIG